MHLQDIAKYRMVNQQLSGTHLTTPQDMVRYFGAMQAQDYAMAKWALGLRLSVSEKVVEHAFAQGDIIRTHLLRPTWHFVAPDDIRWMLSLTAPRIRKLNASLCRKYALDASLLNRCNAIFEKSLMDHHYLTRSELVLALNRQGIDTSELRTNLMIMNAELEGLICSGPRRGKQFTYALLEERVPPTPALTESEALAALAIRYFTSHGPATQYDFAWWSGLTYTQARQALALTASHWQTMTVDDHTYWYSPSLSTENTDPEKVLFLPVFDEFMVSYKDRSASLDSFMAQETMTGNGIFKPIVVIGGKVVGLWERTFKKDKVHIEVKYFYPLNVSQEQAVREAAARFGQFMEMDTVIQCQAMVGL